jgi:peptidoglycan/LPS O-acetylase OafA/YrhL
LFRNPLADPYLLGSASGASLGVALVLAVLGGGAGMLGGNMMNSDAVVSVFSGSVLVRLGLTGAAFAGAVLAVLLTAIVLPTTPAWLPGVAAPGSATAFEIIGAYGALPPILLFYGLCLLLQVLGLLHSVSLRASCALVLLAVALLLALARQLMSTELPATLPLVLSLMLFASLRYEAKHESSSYARRRAREYARYTLRVYLLVVPIIFLAGWSANATAWPRDLFTYVLAIMTFLLFTSRLPLRAPPLVWLGSLSYSLYLLLPAMHRLSELLTQALGLSGPTAGLAGAAFGLLLALGGAQLCRQLLELPLAHAGKRLTRQQDLMPLARLHSR